MIVTLRCGCVLNTELRKLESVCVKHSYTVAPSTADSAIICIEREVENEEATLP